MIQTIGEFSGVQVSKEEADQVVAFLKAARRMVKANYYEAEGQIATTSPSFFNLGARPSVRLRTADNHCYSKELLRSDPAPPLACPQTDHLRSSYDRRSIMIAGRTQDERVVPI